MNIGSDFQLDELESLKDILEPAEYKKKILEIQNSNKKSRKQYLLLAL